MRILVLILAKWYRSQPDVANPGRFRQIPAMENTDFVSIAQGLLGTSWSPVRALRALCGALCGIP